MDTDTRIRDGMKAALEARGWTQQQLAETLGISKSAMAQLLGGSYARVPESLVRALDALGLEIVLRPVGSGEARHLGAANWSEADVQAAKALLIPPTRSRPVRGLLVPVPVEGPPIEELLSEHRGAEG